MTNLDQKAIKTLATLSLEEINAAKSGHPGIALGAAPIMYTLYSKVLKVNPLDPHWINRDRFVLAAGHGSSLLYASLHLAGFDITCEDLKQFRKLKSKTPGHPEIEATLGVDATSGPLGQGIPEAVGMAIAESHLRNKYNKDDVKIIDHYTYVLCGDGDLQEGVTQEAISLAGHLQLSKLIILYDSNNIQLDGKVSMTNTENVKEKYQAMGFSYYLVEDGRDCEEILKAIKKAQKSLSPSLIEIKTKIGAGSCWEDSNKSHGNPLPEEEVHRFRQELGGEAFSVSSDVYDLYKKHQENNLKIYNKEKENEKKYQHEYHNDYDIFYKQIYGDFNIDIHKDLPNYLVGEKKATRASSGEILTLLSQKDPRFIGGSADLASSSKVKGIDGDFSKDNRLGRNLVYGVREHAMAAISNGLALHGGFKPFCGGFFVFCDYMKPAIRLSSLMKLPVLYIFSHDSIAVGEDGPTHQPIEQLTMLRSVPNLNVIRPCDSIEVKEAYDVYLHSPNNPTVLVLTRQDVENIRKEEKENQLAKGGYIIKKETLKLQKILIASGSEVKLAIDVACALEKESIGTRVVSMPSFYLFDKQNQEYKEDVLPKEIAKVAIEASDATHYYKYLSTDDKLINMHTFGESAHASVTMDYFGFTVEKILKEIK